MLFKPPVRSYQAEHSDSSCKQQRASIFAPCSGIHATKQQEMLSAMLVLCTAQPSEGPHSQHAIIPVNSLLRKCQIQSTLKKKKKKTDDVHVLFFTSRTTGQSYLHTAVQINSFHLLYRHYCKTFPSTSLHTTKV